MTDDYFDPTGGLAPDADLLAQTSPRSTLAQSLHHRLPITGSALESFDPRSDPDAQATVTDFVDFTEHLPSDMLRSLTLIGKLDEAHTRESANVHELTTKWGQLPSLPAEERPLSHQLRADISRSLDRCVSSRMFAAAEAQRMHDNICRYLYRAKTIHSKLQDMHANFPTPEQQRQQQEQLQQQRQKQQQQQQAMSKSPQSARQKVGLKLTTGGGVDKARRRRVPRITIPGEVLAPWELDLDVSSEGDDGGEGNESEVSKGEGIRGLGTPVTPLRSIKLVKPSRKPSGKEKARGKDKESRGRAQKLAGRSGHLAAAGLVQPAEGSAPGQENVTPGPLSLGKPGEGGGGGQEQAQVQTAAGTVTTTPAARIRAPPLNPPPADAKPGSIDAPWLQLTPYELGKLRKRMKKNAVWAPSETMIARELRTLGRGIEAYREAKKQAEGEGREFEVVQVPDAEGPGTIRADALSGDEIPTSNRGMRLNAAKKIKREAMAKQAAEEAAGESARRTTGLTGNNIPGSNLSSAPTSAAVAAEQAPSVDGPLRGAMSSRNRQGPNQKRKRKPDEGDGRSLPGLAATAGTTQAERPDVKRVKMEMPVPAPDIGFNGGFSVSADANTSPALQSDTATQATGSITLAAPPAPPRPLALAMAAVQTRSQSAVSSSSTSPISPAPSTAAPSVVAASAAPTRLRRETPVPAPINTNISVGARSGISVSAGSGSVAEAVASPLPVSGLSTEFGPTKRETRGDTSRRHQQISPPLPMASPLLAIGPGPPSSRVATPRSTPAPESATSRRPASRGVIMSPGPSLASERPRRASTARNTPAPDVVLKIARSRRKPAPGVVGTASSGHKSAVGKRLAAPQKKRSQKKDQPVAEAETEVDDEGNPIDPDEQRYCLCNRVSFGTMILCENENCKAEWFHLECVNLDSIPPRTTKWYCPDCRKDLGIGEKGQVDSRGMKS